MLTQNIFRAYDIRGTYPDQLNSETANLIGKGFAAYLVKKSGKSNPTIAVGRDGRTHGEELKTAFIQGLVDSGCEVTDMGICTSPYIYFVDTFHKFDGACNITASHNPKEYNGFKLMTKDAHAVFGEEIQKIYRMIMNADLVSGKGSVKNANYFDDYLNKIKEIFTHPRPLTVVVDTANGVAGAYYPQILKQLGHNVIELFTELDGTFPNHEPDPIVENNLTALKNKVKETGADLGIAFDGDGDRLSIVTEKCEFIDSDKTLMLFAKDALRRHPGRSIVFTVSNSQTLFDLVKEWKGNPIMCKVGHSYVEDSMSTNKAIIGGEQSGHFFLPEDYYYFDDAIIAACRILQIASESDAKVSELFAQFPKTYIVPEMRPECADIVKFDIIKKITEYFKNLYPSNTLDGVRIDFSNGAWAGIRASNTSPRISVTMEAQTQKDLEKIKKIVLDHLNTYPEVKWQ